MPAYDRTPAEDIREIDRWSGGVGWIAHPEEEAQRASHAIATPDGKGVWLLDPLDADGVDALLGEFGPVVGVAVLFNWHARDAGAFARRHGVAVHVPEWMDRVEERIDAPIERYRDGFGDFEVRRYAPIPGWNEALAYRVADGTLAVADAFGSAPGYVVGDERIGMPVSQRPWPPREQLRDCDPERILLGHGAGVFTDAAAALDDALDGARRRLPRALLANGATQLRALYEATTD
jgi:hypothetical protein